MLLIRPNQGKSYYTFGEALVDEGFKRIGSVRYSLNFKPVIRGVYERYGKMYYILNYDHFNTTVYELELRNIDELTNYDLELY